MKINVLVIIILTIHIIWNLCGPKSDYINISTIFKEQIMSILRKKEERKTKDIYNFINIFIVPFILSVFIGNTDLISIDFCQNVISALAILTSVFLTIIGIVTSKSYKNCNDKQREIIASTYNTIYFLTIVSIILLVLCFFAVSLKYYTAIVSTVLPILAEILKFCFKVIIFYLITEIIINIFIVLRRLEQIFYLTFNN